MLQINCNKMFRQLMNFIQNIADGNFSQAETQPGSNSATQ